MTCEWCWNEAYRKSVMLGGHQVDHYRRLLELADHHLDTPAETEPTQGEPA